MPKSKFKQLDPSDGAVVIEGVRYDPEFVEVTIDRDNFTLIAKLTEKTKKLIER